VIDFPFGRQHSQHTVTAIQDLMVTIDFHSKPRVLGNTYDISAVSTFATPDHELPHGHCQGKYIQGTGIMTNPPGQGGGRQLRARHSSATIPSISCGDAYPWRQFESGPISASLNSFAPSARRLSVVLLRLPLLLCLRSPSLSLSLSSLGSLTFTLNSDLLARSGANDDASVCEP
jgi:hypothetical protein